MGIRLTPLCGAREEGGGPRCYLLELDHHRILLDAGVDPVTWDCKHIEPVIGTVSAVLLSHYDLLHLGGLPVIYKHCHGKQTTPMVLGTTPVMHLGRQSLMDAKLSYRDRFGTEYPPCLENVEAAVDMIRPLRYSQPVPIQPLATEAHDPLDTVTVMAMPAGHSLGGAMWRIRRQTASEDILYAVDFDHRRGVCLDGAAFDLLQRPTCLITDCRQALTVAEPRRDRDAAFFATLRSLLVKNNVVLVPVETAAVETIYMFERWCEEEFGNGKQPAPFQIHFITTAPAARTVDYFKGMLEWMGPAMMRQFDQRRDNPFDLRHVKLTSKLADLHGTAGPKLILASGPDLHYGVSLQVLLYYSASSHFHVLFMQEPQRGSVGQELLRLTDTEMTVIMNESQPLEGNDLIRYKKEQRQRREQQEAEAAIARHKSRPSLLDDEDVSESDEADDDEDNVRLADSVDVLKDLYWSDYKTDYWISSSDISRLLLEPTSVTNKRQQQFCFKETRHVNTDYGQTVPTEWLQQQQPVVSDANVVDLVEQARSLIKRRKDQTTETESDQGDPVKWVPVKRKLTVKCQRRVLSGFGGLSDGKSVRNIIGQLAPRRLVLIGGSPSATDYLYNHYLYAASVTGLSQVLAPETGQPVELTSSTASLPAALDESLTETVSVLRRDAYQVGHLLARLKLSDTTNAITLTTVGTPCPMRPVMLGEIRLGDFRRLLLSTLPDINAVFDRGDLVVTGGDDDAVVLRRVDDAGWMVEGKPTLLFEAVRDLFYSQLAVI